MFTFNGTIGIGGDTLLPAAGANGNWGPSGLETLLVNPLPAQTHIRARLQKKVGNNWVDQGAATYLPIP